MTGCDPKKLIRFTLVCAAAQKIGQQELAHRAIALAETQLIEDGFPEYYDGKQGRLIGKEARIIPSLDDRQIAECKRERGKLKTR
ncbi:glycoside hydrolase 100 family protein [Gloeocapsopsis sp. IPPAS B-1203]|uniref:glycoside hydrolase 100 family protein n=1 Tax=Gloeocapsopsis sp. IPPAS B-1203 TaxID=2049454 RepID=UPI0025A070D0|nr:glycoside hydrolase 100 family protein [Gloeocapsopsis sp. IPPAS B-1203]